MPTSEAIAALYWFCVARSPIHEGRRCDGPGGHEVPELAQPVDPVLGRVAGDQRGIDGADRDAGDPVRLQLGLAERGIHAGLVGTERPAALQHQGLAGLAHVFAAGRERVEGLGMPHGISSSGSSSCVHLTPAVHHQPDQTGCSPLERFHIFGSICPRISPPGLAAV
jgi:hypothetical protein